MAVIFSKASGLANDFWNEWADLLTMKMKDTDNEKNNDDELVNALFNVKKSKRFGEKIAGMSTFSNFDLVDEGGVGLRDNQAHAVLLVSVVAYCLRLEGMDVAEANYAYHYFR